MKNSRTLRAEARAALAVNGTYWCYLGGVVVLGFIGNLVVNSYIFAHEAVCRLMLPAGAELRHKAIGQVVLAIPPSSLAAAVSVALFALVVYWAGFLWWSTYAMALASSRGGLRFGHAFSGWGNGWRMALTMFASTFYTMLWTLLLVVPGIVKGFSYALTPLVAIDHPDWGANRCITESRRLMAGNKWRLFKLLLSFIGWIVLIFAFVLASQIAINLGGSRMQPFLAFVLLAPDLLQPYVCTAFARFYEEILDEDESKGRQ